MVCRYQFGPNLRVAGQRRGRLAMRVVLHWEENARMIFSYMQKDRSPLRCGALYISNAGINDPAESTLSARL